MTAALYCKFRDLDDLLLDQLIYGVRDVHLKCCLLARMDDMLQSALDEALDAKLSDKSSSKMQKSASLVTAQKSSTIHHDSVDDDPPSDDDRVNRLKTATKSDWGHFTKKGFNPCAGCGGNHNRSACRFRNAECRRCGKKGHLAKVCRANLPDPRKTSKPSEREFCSQGRPGSKEDDCYTIYGDQTEGVVGQTRDSLTGKIFLTVVIEGQPCRMEVDTGSSISIVSWSAIKCLVPTMSKRSLAPCTIRLRDYQGKVIPILGIF